MMESDQPVTIYRKDYRPFGWHVPHTRLYVSLHPTATRVRCELDLIRRANPEGKHDNILTLDGVELELESISLDGAELPAHQYQVSESQLSITHLPEHCTLQIITLINPQANTALEGLYRSSGNFCTQCEAEGFRKITYYPDRPDVLSVYDVTIEAEVEQCPVMLCNGNLESTRLLSDNRHCTHWHDPHPKPCYLFALVAGRLSVVEDHFQCASGRDVLLQIYVEEHNIERCDYAMQSLKKSMRWDEQVYGFEYDLERFMIVAVDDFNMGAMENKGLNIFNSRYVLADMQTATDTDFAGIESVVAHEYFHNWTGNRITCRDWFQLSLKEGLTVFRDQCFSADQRSAVVKRIEDVKLLRSRQFPEDAGPMSHPIRPDSYIEINNFYTLTVYEKGAEVIRMLHTLLGAESWRRGMDVYVQRHDGTATTCEAFVDAMQSVTEIDLEQFRSWYTTAGTPELEVIEHFDEVKSEYHLDITQRSANSVNNESQSAMHIPLVMGLLDKQGRSLVVDQGRSTDDPDSVVFDLRDKKQRLIFTGLSEKPVPSLLRGFSAPVKLQQAVDNSTLSFLMSHDTDLFNRWEAGQRLSQRVILSMLDPQGALVLDKLNQDAVDNLLASLMSVLADDTLDVSFRAVMMMMPTLPTLANSLSVVDYRALNEARVHLLSFIAREFETILIDLVQHGRDPELALMDPLAIGQRELANTALSLLSHLPSSSWEFHAARQFTSSENMTDRLAALASLCDGTGESRERALQAFYVAAQGNRLVVDKWFAVQAMSRRSQVLDDVLELIDHPDFDALNPNRLRSLVGSFAMNNPVGFHIADGRGYEFLADQVISLNATNPQMAARLVIPLTQWRPVVREQAALMQEQLKRIKGIDGLSPDVYELVNKALT